MDAIKLKLRAKDQLHPLMTELMSGYTRFKNSNEWEGRPKILHWCVCTLASLQADLVLTRDSSWTGSSRSIKCARARRLPKSSRGRSVLPLRRVH